MRLTMEFQLARKLSRLGVWWALAALMLCFGSAVHAQKVLLLGTGEDPANMDVPVYFENMAREFGKSPADVKYVLSGPEISSTLFTEDPGPYDVVVVGTVYSSVTPANWAVLADAIKTRKANSFVMFVDACCEGSTRNITNFQSHLSSITGWSGVTVGSPVSGNLGFPLNSSSSFAAGFSDPVTGLHPFWGNDTSYYEGIPRNNALYLSPTANATSSKTDAYGLFVPTTESNSGAGACLFLVNDISGFYSGSLAPDNMIGRNSGKIGSNFLKAVSAGGVCGLPASIASAFSVPTVGPGGVANLVITITNHTAPVLDAVPGLRVEAKLPAPLLVNGAPTTTCTGGTLSNTTGTIDISLTGATLPALATCTITVPVRWTPDAANTCGAATSVLSTIAPGVAPVGEFSTNNGQVNVRAEATLACSNAIVVPSPSGAAPIPSLNVWMQWLLSAMVAAMGWMWMRRRSAPSAPL